MTMEERLREEFEGYFRHIFGNYPNDVIARHADEVLHMSSMKQILAENKRYKEALVENRTGWMVEVQRGGHIAWWGGYSMETMFVFTENPNQAIIFPSKEVAGFVMLWMKWIYNEHWKHYQLLEDMKVTGHAWINNVAPPEGKEKEG